MYTKTPYRKQSDHRTSKSRSNKDTFVKTESPAFVPRHIVLEFMKIDGVTDVTPLQNTPEQLDVIVQVKQDGYNHNLHEKIISVEYEIKKALDSRQQKFEASIAW